MTKAVFFDMNETLMNLSVLKERFDTYFDDKYVYRYWFAKLLHTSTVSGIMDGYQNFGKLAEVVLDSLFCENGKILTPEIKADILGAFLKLPAYADVPVALAVLRENKIKTIAVSNSSLEMIEKQLTNAGIINLFDAYYSVDSVQKYKPFGEIYQYVANQEHCAPEEVVMLATHDWDLYGAKKAGLKTAYIQRKEEIYNPYFCPADFANTNLVDLVNEIINA